MLFRRSTRTRRTRSARFAAEVAQPLEARTLLAGGANVVIGAGATGDIVVDGSRVQSVQVLNGATLGTLTILGDQSATRSDIRVNIQHDAFVNVLDVQGGRGTETATIRGIVETVNFIGGGGSDTLGTFGTSQVGSINFQGDTGNDRLVVTGFVGGDVNVDGGLGNDRLAISDRADVRGTVVGSLGGGDDRVVIQSGPAGQTKLNNVALDLGDGTNVFDFFSPTQIKGDLTLEGGSGTDVVRFRGGRGVDDVLGNVTINTGAGNDDVALAGPVNISGDFALDTGENSDRVSFESLTLLGSQTIDLGGAAGGRDSLKLGDDRISGSSAITSVGNVFLQEREQRIVGGDYTVVVGDARLDAALTGGSVVGGDIKIQSGAVATVALNATVLSGRVDITTDRGNDRLFLSGLRVENGPLNIRSGAGDDRISLRGAAVGGTLFVDAGLGDDTVLNGGRISAGVATYLGGAGFDFLTSAAGVNASGFEQVGPTSH